MFEAWTELTGRPALRPPDRVRPHRAARRGGRPAGQRGHAAGARRADRGRRRRRASPRLAPGMRTDDLTEVRRWEPNGGYGDGALVAGDLLAAARERGVRYRPHTPVQALLRRRRPGDRGARPQDGAGTRRDRGRGGRGMVAGPARPASASTCRSRPSSTRSRCSATRQARAPRGLHRLDHPDLLPARGGRQRGRWSAASPARGGDPTRTAARAVRHGRPAGGTDDLAAGWSARPAAAGCPRWPRRGSPAASPACTT